MTMTKPKGIPDAASGAVREVIGPEDESDLLGCQDEAELKEGSAVERVVISGNGLNLRTAPSPDGAVMAVLPTGCGVFVLDQPDEEWARVRTGWLEGYVMARYLSQPPSPVSYGDAD